MAIKYLLVICVIGLGSVLAQDKLSEGLNSLPPELQGKVSEEQLKNIQNKTTQAFKEKCDKSGGPGAYDKVEKSFKEFLTCIQGLVNQEQLQKEIEEAKPNGRVDEVFKGYCDKTPQFKTCFFNLTESAKPCFQSAEQTSLNTVYNITEQLAHFVCFKEGDRIALFIAEGGPECIKEKQEPIQACVNSTFGVDANIDASALSIDNLPTIAFGEKECKQYTILQKCVVKALETCEQPTSANIVESLFKFALKATPCQKYIKQEVTTGSASVATMMSATLVSALVAIYFV